MTLEAYFISHRSFNSLKASRKLQKNKEARKNSNAIPAAAKTAGIR